MLRLIIVRHGHPDYKTDSLTEEGKPQAVAVSKRLANEGIREIYSSSCGRAVETAQPTAELLGLPIHKLDFMREVAWGKDHPSNLYHPWRRADELAEKNIDLLTYDYASDPDWGGTLIDTESRRVDAGLDEWLAGLGYVREGNYYRVTAKEDNTVALFAHGGSSSIAIAYLLGLPYPYLFRIYRPQFTCITEIIFGGKEGDLSAPMLHILNDYRHIAVEGKAEYGY